MRIGFIGVGNMGHAMAGHLLAAGHSLVVHDLRREAAATLLAAGAAWAESPRAAAAHSEIVATCLPGPSEMEAVALGPDGILEGLAAGAVYIDHTTNSPRLIRQIDAVVRARGAAMLDAPVSGGMEGARTRDLLVMVGGDGAVFERVRPVLDALAARVIYTGGIGNGSVCKLMHNCASFSLDLLLAECWTAGVKAGVMPETLVDVFRNAALGHMMSLKVRLPATYLRGHFNARFALRLAHKDLALAVELGRAYGVPMRLSTLCEQELAAAMARGWGERDASIALTLQEERAGVQVRLPE
jgi:3-hydroxyisobutyrate dehydrogenase-like beta-hydroxyacid dehydrogenase